METIGKARHPTPRTGEVGWGAASSPLPLSGWMPGSLLLP